MTQAKKPFLPISRHVDDNAIEELARLKGVPALSFSTEPERPRPDPVEPRGTAVKPAEVPVGRTADRAPAATGRPAPSAPQTAGAVRAPVTRVKIGIPDYACKELGLRQLEDDVTMTYLVLLGLKAIGITIKDADLVEDGRRLRGSRTS